MNVSYTKKLEEALNIATSIAKENHHASYGAPHLLKALLHKNVGLSDLFFATDTDTYYIDEWCEVRLENYPKTANVPNKINFDKEVQAVFTEGKSLMLKLGGQDISEVAVLISLCTPGVGFSYEQLKTLPLQPASILEYYTNNKNTSIKKTGINNGINDQNLTVDTSILSKFCIDKKAQGKNNELKKVFGRDGSLKTIIEILGRHSKSSVLILGDSGVGKTILFDGFTQQIIDRNIPKPLENAEIFEIDLIKLISGTTYKSEVEDRFKKILNSLKSFEKPIALIDNLQELTNKDNGNTGLINILKSELSKHEITFIATSSQDGFRKHIEPNQGLARLFELVTIEEPSQKETLRIISKSIAPYESFHGLNIDSQSIEEAIRLATRFTKDRSLPDVAFDLIDRTLSATRYMLDTTNNQIEKTKQEIEEILTIEDSKQVFTELQWLGIQLKERFSYLLFAELENETLISSCKTIEEVTSTLQTILEEFATIHKNTPKNITKSFITATIANKTGIPIGKLQTNEKERLLAIENTLKKRVIGQDVAIKSLSGAILESRSGLSKPGLPVGSFFFTGPTGTGKTELAKSLAEFLFQSEEAIIRFDMSEFKEEHSAALLYGAPPGYVGYEEGGVLVNKIRERPYSIVLFDEIEKAHPSVFDIFLQILDEGKLSDRLGKIGDFSNAVILFTSNIGSEQVVQAFNSGNTPNTSDLLETMGNYFRPEFLGRLTEIVPFAPISKDHIVKIFDIQMKDLYAALKRQDIELELSMAAKEQLALQGFTPKYGARPIRGVIRSEIRSVLSKKIIKEEISKGTKVFLDAKAGILNWDFQNKK